MFPPIFYMMDIKKLQPNKNSRYRQGAVHPDACRKLFESQRRKPIIYRSSYEWRFINWLEHSPKVKRWGSECMNIPYTLGGVFHTYYPDFVVELVNGTIWVVEIKPKNQTHKPSNQNTYAWEQWLKNKEKWRYAIDYCNKHNLSFKIFTEDTINRLV